MRKRKELRRPQKWMRQPDEERNSTISELLAIRKTKLRF